jgi:hypothetical protein
MTKITKDPQDLLNPIRHARRVFVRIPSVGKLQVTKQSLRAAMERLIEEGKLLETPYIIEWEEDILTLT